MGPSVRTAAFLALISCILVFGLPYRVGMYNRLEFHHLLWKLQVKTEHINLDPAILAAEFIGVGLLAFLTYRPLKNGAFKP